MIRETQCCWLGRWRKWAVNQGMWEASKAGKGKEQILPRASRRECSPVNTLMSAQWDPCQTSNIRNYEVIYLYCFKPFKSSVICHNSNKKQTRHEMHSFWLCQLKPVTHTCTHACTHAHTHTHRHTHTPHCWGPRCRIPQLVTLTSIAWNVNWCSLQKKKKRL